MNTNYYCNACGMSVSDEHSFVCKSCGQKLCRRCAFENNFQCPNCHDALK
ncbi:MAG: hypothetical protein RR107_05155 [Clostridia bacterium]